MLDVLRVSSEFKITGVQGAMQIAFDWTQD